VIGHNTINVVIDHSDHALMFSRHPIPYPHSTRNNLAHSPATVPTTIRGIGSRDSPLAKSWPGVLT
jgi:CMP-2-keto-3-deoxyoctulosonic acid synthetase